MDDLLTSAAMCDIKHPFYQYAFNNEKGIGRDIDYEDALRYHKLGAENGDTKCMVRYGLMQELGVEKNSDEATKYYKMAADKDDYDGYYITHLKWQPIKKIRKKQQNSSQNLQIVVIMEMIACLDMVTRDIKELVSKRIKKKLVDSSDRCFLN